MTTDSNADAKNAGEDQPILPHGRIPKSSARDGPCMPRQRSRSRSPEMPTATFSSRKLSTPAYMAKLGMTKERLRIVEEERNYAIRQRKLETVMVKYRVGEARRTERILRERREEVRRILAVSVRNKLENFSVQTIQRVFRGYDGRKNVYNWALKRAEWEAMKMVMRGSAVIIQRYYRGYLGRIQYKVMRTEISQVRSSVEVKWRLTNSASVR